MFGGSALLVLLLLNVHLGHSAFPSQCTTEGLWGCGLVASPSRSFRLSEVSCCCVTVVRLPQFKSSSFHFKWLFHVFFMPPYKELWEKAMATHSSTLVWEILWMEEPGGLQSVGSLTVGHDWATSLSLFTFMHWRRKWQPTPVFLPGESQGWEPDGLPSMGSHRVGHDWRDLAAWSCIVMKVHRWICFFSFWHAYLFLTCSLNRNNNNNLHCFRLFKKSFFLFHKH